MVLTDISLPYVCCILFFAVTSGQVYISTSKSIIEEGDTFEVNCTVRPLTSAVRFFLDGNPEGDCTAPVTGIAAGTCPTNINQNINTDETTLTITSASVTTHKGTWKCTHNTESAEIVVDIFKFITVLTNNQYELPATIETSSTPNLEFKVFVACGNPQPTITWILDTCDGSQTGIAVNSPTLTTNTSAGCTSPLVAYTSAIKVSSLASPTVETCYIPKATMTYTEKPSVMPSSQFTSQVQFPGPTVTTEMSSTSTSQDQTTSSQNPSVAPFHNTQKTETTVMTTTDNDLTSSSLHVSSEVTTPMKTESDNLTDLGVSAIIAIAISGFIFLFLIIIFIICCCQYYRKKSKKKTSEEFQEIHDDVVPKFWPNFNSHRYGLNEINGASVHLARGYNLYQGEHNRGYNFRSKHQSDNYNRSRSDRKIITEKRKHKQKQVQEKISHGFPQSIPDDIMNRHDINGINTYDLYDNNQNTRTYNRGHAVSSPRRFEYRGSFLPHEYINSNRRSSPYMTYLQEHVPRDLEGLTFYQGHNGATNKHSRRYY